MRFLSTRILIPATILLAVWGGAHLLTQPGNLAVQSATWPLPAPAASAAPTSAIATAPPTSPPPSSSGPVSGVPILPGAMQQLNGSTRDTAVGLYALIQQLELALRGHIDDLVQQLEPGR